MIISWWIAPHLPLPPRAETSRNIELNVENREKYLLTKNRIRIFMKIAAAQVNYIEITYTKFHLNLSKKYMESTDTNLFAPFRKGRFRLVFMNVRLVQQIFFGCEGLLGLYRI
jgi:hypothetical protein